MSASPRRRLLDRFAIGVAIALAAAIASWAAAHTPFIHRVELTTYDWRVRLTARPTTPSPDVVLVWIDDDSVRRMAEYVGRWPWPRMAHAPAIDFLARAGAKLVVYDVLFGEADTQRFTFGGEVAPDGTTGDGEEWTGRESDAAFAEAIARAGIVVLAADATPEALVDSSKALPVSFSGIPALDLTYDAGPCVERREQLIPPLRALAASARAIGHNFLVLDADGPARRLVPFVRVGDRHVPSLPVAAALAAQGLAPEAVRADGLALQIGRARLPLIEEAVPDFYGKTDRACRALIPFRGPVLSDQGTSTFREYSFYELVRSENQIAQGQRPSLDPSLFKDRVVVIGASAAATYDTFAVPFVGRTPGAFVHATIIDALLRGRTIAPASSASGVIVTVLAALAIAGAGVLVTPWTLAALSVATALVLAFGAVRWFAGGLWMPLVMPLVAIGAAFVGQLAWQYFVEGREKRQVKRLFSRYVPKDVYDQLLADPTRAALGGRRRTMTVLFSDVRGFTSMSEKATPEEVVGQLNEYFSRMVAVLFKHHGTLDKFVGDMVMGLFGAPLDDPDHAEHAVEAALAMTSALEDLNRGWAAAGRPVLDIGIGISTGDMVAGNIGSDTIMSYTVIGDTVNLGARLESLNKEYGTRIIISEATRSLLKERYDMRPLGDVKVKGKSQAVAIYEVKPR
jgi:adenylate cyclase